jgi:hypothetical protein
MLTRILLYIKHNLRFIWKIIEAINGSLFKLVYKKKMDNLTRKTLADHSLEDTEFRLINSDDIPALADFFIRQRNADLEYFKPHGFDRDALTSVLANDAFIMMGAFKGEKIVGYFFLRCFLNQKCFVGRIVDYKYQGTGIGRIMNDIMYNIAWGSGFRCLSTISTKNSAVMTAHSKNKTMVVLKTLDNNYLLVEFINPATEDHKN